MRTHAELVRDLSKPGSEILETLTPDRCHLLHMALGIAGEAGEILDVIKKHVIYNQEINMNHIVEELGDISYYLEGLRQGLNLNQEDILSHNIFKLEKRYGTKYSDQAAKERADKKQNSSEYVAGKSLCSCHQYE